MKVTVLGCGASTGVPAIGPDWGRCDPADPRNRRRRVSALVEIGDVVILIDTSPDLREQLIDAGVVAVGRRDGDPCACRPPARDRRSAVGQPADAAGDPALCRRKDLGRDRPPLRLCPRAAVRSQAGSTSRPCEPHEIRGPFEIAGIPVVPFAQDHGFSTTLGLRIGGFAYSTDVTELDDAAFAAVEGVELWIVDCLRREPHPTHSHLAKTLSWIARVRPRRAVLTHMDQSLDYRELSAELPSGVEPGQDGLVIELPDP